MVHLGDGVDYATKLDIMDKISASNLGLFKCGLFQERTGQRITSAVASLPYFDSRVTALIDARGKTELKK